jgi:mono/diheme cytochrome c family protein
MRALSTPLALAALLALAACGGGGADKPADIVPLPSPVPVDPQPATGNFLQMPNPQLLPDGSSQINSRAYADAYYEAIDPDGKKATLDGWRQANGFGSSSGNQVTVAFGDRHELAWGRRLTARRNADGTMAFMVENFEVKVGGSYSYSPLSATAAAVRDTRWHLDTHGIEFSPGPNGGASFVKFFAFNAATGKRETVTDMDGRGTRSVPGACLACHGGRGDPLTPPDASGKQRFPLLANAVSQARGDLMGRAKMLELDTFDFAATPGYSRAEQEAALKTINQMVLCSYPLAGTSTHPEDACRRKAVASEWQGTAATMLKAAYGGPGMPSATYSNSYVEPSWVAAGQSALYASTFAQSCRGCHIVRGTGLQNDVDMETFAKFNTYAPATKALVFDRGTMPLSAILADNLFASSSGTMLADFLQTKAMVVRDSAGALLKPNRPIADTGPERVLLPGANVLSAAGSVNADAYQWSIVSGPAGASFSDARAQKPVFTANTPGSYVLQLVASQGSLSSAPVQLKITIDSTLSPAPSAIRFADIKAVLSAPGRCVGCHKAGGDTPDIYLAFDRNGDGVIDKKDDDWFYAEVRGRVNFTGVANSPMLTKPSGRRHSKLAGFDATKAAGHADRKDYDLFLNWMLNGAPQ